MTVERLATNFACLCSSEIVRLSVGWWSLLKVKEATKLWVHSMHHSFPQPGLSRPQARFHF